MITKTKIKSIKNKVYSLQNKINTCNPLQLSKYLDVEILYRPYKKQMGAFTLINKVPFIFVNENLNYEEKQNVIAHELGHYILHKKIIKDLLILRDYSLFSKRESEMEKEANLFAAFLLIDDKQYKELKSQNKSNREISIALKVNVELINIINSSNIY